MKNQLRQEIETFVKEHPSDITEHLLNMFDNALEMNPKFIMELGIRNGDSTKVLVNVAKLCNSKIISIDINPTCYKSIWKEWQFVIMDSANEKILKQLVKNEKIDVLFIDTSHTFGQTLKELEIYNKYLNDNSLIILHDTFSANPDSRVGQAIEAYYNLEILDWSKNFTIKFNKITLSNYGNNNGMCFIWQKKN